MDNVVEGSSANKPTERFVSVQKRQAFYRSEMLVESTNISRPLCVKMHVVVMENEAISFLLRSDTAAVLKAFLFEHETRKDIAPLSAMGRFRYLNASIVRSLSCSW